MNLKENVSAITLRGAKQLDEMPRKAKEAQEETKQQKDLPIEKYQAIAPIQPPKKHPMTPIPLVVLALPFSSGFAKSKKEETKKEILDTFCKVQVNIPLLDAIKQVSWYAKFLKELCTNKQVLKGDEKVKVGENIFIVLQRKLTPNCKDLGTFAVPCKIGNTHFEMAMLDVGASINVMPYSIYASFNHSPLEEIGVIIQLAD